MSYLLLAFLAGTVCGYALNTIRAHRRAVQFETGG